MQHLFSTRHQLLIKYDWYDPDIEVKGQEIGTGGTNFNSATIKFSTLGIGYLAYISDNAKLLLYFAKARNESTSLPGFTQDVSDYVFTCRTQFRF